jgi:hypothetical protein
MRYVALNTMIKFMFGRIREWSNAAIVGREKLKNDRELSRTDNEIWMFFSTWSTRQIDTMSDNAKGMWPPILLNPCLCHTSVASFNPFNALTNSIIIPKKWPTVPPSSHVNRSLKCTMQCNNTGNRAFVHLYTVAVVKLIGTREFCSDRYMTLLCSTRRLKAELFKIVYNSSSYVHVRGSSANNGEGIVTIGARGEILRRA